MWIGAGGERCGIGVEIGDWAFAIFVGFGAGGCANGYGDIEVTLGGSIRLEMEGDALARFADFCGEAWAGALKGVCDTGDASTVVDRIGS